MGVLTIPVSTRIALIAAAVAIALASLSAPGEAAPATPFTPGPASAGLTAVSALSSRDVWAAGSRRPRGFLSADALFQHWDGIAWRTQGETQHHARLELQGVKAIASDDVWAVGDRLDHPADQRSLTEHWDGTSWERIPSPNGSGSFEYDQLNGVDGTSSSDLWAVGFCVPQNTYKGLAEHWDGNAWSIVSLPSTGTSDKLNGISELTPDDAWAVGDSADGSTISTLVEHWDGTYWSIVPSPDLNQKDTLTSVTAISSGDVWAVGSYLVGDGTTSAYPLALHYDGTSWKVVHVAMPTVVKHGVDLTLQSVSAAGPDDIWAVGMAGTIERWNGHTWSTVNSGVQSPALYGVSVVAADDAWAVGLIAREHGSHYQALRLHWDGTRWSRA